VRTTDRVGPQHVGVGACHLPDGAAAETGGIQLVCGGIGGMTGGIRGLPGPVCAPLGLLPCARRVAGGLVSIAREEVGGRA